MIRRSLLACGTLVALPIHPTVAQSDSALLAPGTPVRIESRVTDSIAGPKNQRMEGRVLWYTRDTIFLDPTGLSKRRAVPMNTVQLVEIGRRNYSLGFVSGAVTSGLIFALINQNANYCESPKDPFAECTPGSSGQWIAGSALLGGLVGLIGAPYRWIRVNP